MELAVFGAILLFVVGIIVRQALMQGYRQNHGLRSMREAMLTSYKFSQGLEGKNRGIGDASRNVGNILLVEDRLNSDAGKYGAMDRIPIIAQGTATHSRNLFLPVDPGEYFNLPVMDLLVNGVRIPILTAGFKTIVIDPIGEPFFYQKNFNSPTNNKWCDGVTRACPVTVRPPWCDTIICPTAGRLSQLCCSTPDMTADERFDLDRNGSTDVPVAERQYFAWQWIKIPVRNVAKNMVVDVDNDLKEERVILAEGGTIIVIDSQEGDADFTINTRDEQRGVKKPGFTQDMQMYTLSTDGTYYLIEEGKLFGPGRQFVRNSWRKDSIDIVSRQFQLSKNTGRFCSGPVLNTGETNPVEVCGNCFSDISRTCLDTGSNILYIRSRILDRHGRKWVTDLSNDDRVNFVIP